MLKVLLFMNRELGLKILEEIEFSENFQVEAIILNSRNKLTLEYEEKVRNHSIVASRQIPIFRYSDSLLGRGEFTELVNNCAFGVSVLFSHLLPKDFLANAGIKFYNLHPSLLPENRGSDPIPWSIIEKRPIGVTIHEIDSGLDTGNICYQQEVTSSLGQTAGDLYESCLNQLKLLFSRFLNEWPTKLVSRPQTGTPTSHKSSDLEELRESLLVNSSEIEKSVRIIQALTFNDGRSAILRASDGHLWRISVTCNRIEEK